MTLPIATADTDSIYRHRFHNIVSVYEDPVSVSSQPTSLDQFEVFSHIIAPDVWLVGIFREATTQTEKDSREVL